MRARLALVSTALIACGGGSKLPAGDSATSVPGNAASPSPVATPSAAAPNDSVHGTVDVKGCLHDGRWRACGFVDRLERSGLVVGAARDTVRHDFLSVPGIRYELGRGAAEAYFYDDTTRLTRDIAGLDTQRVAPRGGYQHWDVPASFVRSQNLIVLVLSANEHLVERVQLAVEAGAPQPEPPQSPQSLAPVTAKP